MGLGRAPGLPATLADARVLAPDNLPLECANALWKYVRAGHVRRDVAAALLRRFLDLRIELVPAARLAPAALEFALELDLTAYDAAYVVVAHVADATLVTADKRLAAAYARSELIA